MPNTAIKNKTSRLLARLFLFCCFFCIFVSCATPPFHTDKSRTVPSDFFGVSPYIIEPEDFPLIDELGAVWLRRTCRWGNLEPVPGQWNFSDWDNFVEYSNNAQKKILAILAFDTPWLYGEEKIPRKITAREMPMFLNYVDTVVNRYKGKIDAYEIWNEPNMMSWYGSDEEFITMTRSVIKTIRSIDPDVKILAGSFWRVPKRFIRKLIRAGVFDEASGLSFHPYATSPKGVVKLCDSLLKLLEEEGFAGEVWVTEIGFPTKGWFPTRVSEINFPSHIVKTLASLAARDMSVLLWYELFDEKNPGEYTLTLNSEDFFGLAYRNNTVKAGYYAFALCGQKLAGKEYSPDLPKRNNLPERTVSLCFTGRGGENVLIIWNESGRSFSADITLPGKDQHLYEINSGISQRIEGKTETTVTQTPKFFTWVSDGYSASGIPVITKK